VSVIQSSSIPNNQIATVTKGDTPHRSAHNLFLDILCQYGTIVVVSWLNGELLSLSWAGRDAVAAASLNHRTIDRIPVLRFPLQGGEGNCCTTWRQGVGVCRGVRE
jgi:hypothetical protein